MTINEELQITIALLQRRGLTQGEIFKAISEKRFPGAFNYSGDADFLYDADQALRCYAGEQNLPCRITTIRTPGFLRKGKHVAHIFGNGYQLAEAERMMNNAIRNHASPFSAAAYA